MDWTKQQASDSSQDTAVITFQLQQCSQAWQSWIDSYLSTGQALQTCEEANEDWCLDQYGQDTFHWMAVVSLPYAGQLPLILLHCFWVLVLNTDKHLVCYCTLGCLL